jgi:hypothetical protein
VDVLQNVGKYGKGSNWLIIVLLPHMVDILAS